MTSKRNIDTLVRLDKLTRLLDGMEVKPEEVWVIPALLDIAEEGEESPSFPSFT